MCALPGELVLSDVHRESTSHNRSKSLTVSSRFPFMVPITMTTDVREETIKDKTEQQLDEDGDIIIRKRQESWREQMNEVITIEHMMATEIGKVGLQVWLASLLLCDFILANKSLFTNAYILELGSGTGLCSILLASLNTKGIFCTDTGEDVLAQCQSNIFYNSHLTDQPHSSPRMRVRNLDWTKDYLCGDIHDAFHWTEEDRSLLQQVEFIIAADVIYDNRLTDAFFKTLKRLMTGNGIKTAFIALEKRLNFTLDQLRVRSPAHDHFMVWVDSLRKDRGFNCQQIGTDFPKCFNYTRTKELELWQVSYSPCEG